MNAVPSHDQFPDRDVMIPRFREAGDVTLDLFHRDGRVDDRGRLIGTHPDGGYFLDAPPAAGLSVLGGVGAG